MVELTGLTRYQHPTEPTLGHAGHVMIHDHHPVDAFCFVVRYSYRAWSAGYTNQHFVSCTLFNEKPKQMIYLSNQSAILKITLH